MTPTNYVGTIDKETGEVVVTWFDGEQTLERRLLPISAPYTIAWLPDQNDWVLLPSNLPFGAIPYATIYRD